MTGLPGGAEGGRGVRTRAYAAFASVPPLAPPAEARHCNTPCETARVSLWGGAYLRAWSGEAMQPLSRSTASEAVASERREPLAC